MDGILTNQALSGLCRGLALVLHAGIPLADGMYLLAQEEQGNLKPLLDQLAQALDRGEALEDALEASGVFPHYITGMIRIGQRTGRLEEALNTLADYFEERRQTDALLRSAVAYPAMILALMLAVVGVLLVKVLPVFDRVYASLGSRLTGAAAGLLHLGQLLEGALPWLLGLLAVLGGLALVCYRIPSLRNKVQAIFGDQGISRKFNNARFARAMAMGLGSGLHLEEALELAALLLSDVPGAAARCQLCASQLKQEAALSDAMAAAGLLPAAHSRMLALGLRGGNADLVMEQIADGLMEEAEAALAGRIAKIEPAMVLGASLLVGLILLTVMLPLMNILSSLG